MLPTAYAICVPNVDASSQMKMVLSQHVEEYVHHVGCFTRCAFPHLEEATIISIAKCAVQAHGKTFVSDAMKAQAAILEYV